MKTCKDIWLPSFSVLRRTVLGEQIERKSVSFQDVVMSKDIFMSIFLWQMEVFVLSVLNLFLISHSSETVKRFLIKKSNFKEGLILEADFENWGVVCCNILWTMGRMKLKKGK